MWFRKPDLGVVVPGYIAVSLGIEGCGWYKSPSSQTLGAFKQTQLDTMSYVLVGGLESSVSIAIVYED